MERREFIRESCTLCAAIGAGLIIGSMASCSSPYLTTISENKITVPVSLFAKKELQIIRPEHFENDIALRKEANGMYTALLLRCTHADNQLVSTGKEFVCDLHGSRFDRKGSVITGPAERPLKKYSTEVNSDSIIIKIS